MTSAAGVPVTPPWRGRTAHRTSTPEAMAALRWGRLGRGWSMTEAASRTGVSRPMISLLESGQRRPSESVADDLIDAYGLDDDDAEAVRAIARPLAGRDSPYRTGAWPELDPDSCEGTYDRATDLFPATQGATVPDTVGAEAWIAWAKRKAEAVTAGPRVLHNAGQRTAVGSGPWTRQTG